MTEWEINVTCDEYQKLEMLRSIINSTDVLERNWGKWEEAEYSVHKDIIYNVQQHKTLIWEQGDLQAKIMKWFEYLPLGAHKKRYKDASEKKFLFHMALQWCANVSEEIFKTYLILNVFSLYMVWMYTHGVVAMISFWSQNWFNLSFVTD